MKLGILGTGKIVQEILPMVEKMRFEKIDLLATRHSEQKGKDLCDIFHLDGCYFDYDELLASDTDAIYVALPNHLHFDYAKKALQAGKHVLLEKPATLYARELKELIEIAHKNHLIFTEAMSLHYTPAYRQLKTELSKLGNIKIVNFQFCQYSSRYDRFLQGDIAPAFDPHQYGGALMDLNVYNLHSILGLFGTPQFTNYFPNMDRGIDTSGILLMQYPGFQAIAIAAKDCQGPVCSTIIGTKGCIRIQMPMNQISGYDILDHSGTVIKQVNLAENVHRLSYEFTEFQRMVAESDFTMAHEICQTSLNAVRILENMRPY